MFKSILLPIDLDNEASWKRALPVALATAQREKAVLHVCSVFPDFGAMMVSSYFETNFEEIALHNLGERLAAWVAINVPADIEVHPHVLYGRVHDQIIRAADKLDVDLIVMGSHKHELKDYVLGPNAQRVVGHARQSVFVVRGE